MLGGSGKDVITTASDRNTLDFGNRTLLPFDKQATTAKKVNLKVADFSFKDGLDVGVGATTPTDLLNVRDGSVDKLFITADATITPVDLVTEFGKAPAESRITNCTRCYYYKPRSSGEPTPSKGFDIPTKGTGTDYHSATAGVLSGAPAPILPVSGKIDLAHVTGDHFTTSKANLLAGA